MPRLVGKKNSPALYAGFGFLLVLIGAIALDYFGIVNFIPNFGQEANTNNTSRVQPLPIGK